MNNKATAQEDQSHSLMPEPVREIRLTAGPDWITPKLVHNWTSLPLIGQ